MSETQPPHIEIELETMAYGGSAIGRHEGRVVFVSYAIPGETVEAEILEDRGRVAFAKGVRLITASADRVFPICPHFGPGKCGRCQWQHIDIEAQQLIKQDVLADQLERVGGIKNPTVRPVIPSPKSWNYNNHMTFTVSDQGYLGFPGAEGGIHPIEVCEILHPDLLDLYQQLDVETEGLTRITLMRGSNGERMIILTAAAEEAPELELDMPASINLLLPDNEPVNLAGNTHVIYNILGRPFRVTAGSDFRRNTEALPGLVTAVLEALGDATSVLDVYSGVGLFAAFIAEKADYVTVIESYPPAATDADENTADLDHVDVIEGNAEDVLEAAADEYDAAVVNPPAAGLSVEALDALGALSLRTLVYVSSDAATFSRDAKRLTNNHGFVLDYIQPLDFDPQTYYLEMVARFVKKG